jgi:hypothetical protein
VQFEATTKSIPATDEHLGFWGTSLGEMLAIQVEVPRAGA